MNDKFMTRQQLANELGISTRTLSRKLNALNIKLPSGLLSPKLYKELSEKLRS